MKKRVAGLVLVCSLVVAVHAAEKTFPTDVKSTYARFVPERLDDFAWENDLIAFRAYGPACSKVDAGIDCWMKRVTYPIVNKWYYEAENGKSYHTDTGEGCDYYHVGTSAGCGGTALWVDGAMVQLGKFKSWKLLEESTEKTSFVLTYESDVNGATYKEEKQITIELGKRLFKAESTFYKNGAPVANLPVVAALTTHDGKGTVSKDIQSGWVSVWESSKKNGSWGTGIVMNPADIKSFASISMKQKDKSHAALVAETDAQGKLTYYAGFGWSKAGEITTEQQWIDYLKTFSKSL